VALGALQGPAELLPVSSSGHIVLVPELLRWPYGTLDPALRKAFEVALHAGTAAALSIALRDEVAEVLVTLRVRRLLGIALAFVPPAAAAFEWERPIEERLGSARSVAWAQLLAGAALGAADRRPAERPFAAAGLLDHALVGMGQAAALVPGVSRGGASLTALRLRRFERPAAHRLSRHAALPVILAAAGLKGARLARRGLPPGLRAPFAAGAAAAFASTALSARLIPRMDAAPSYLPFALYRVGIGVLTLARARARVASGG
jgi:undecaprenyl-diphosphatase